MTNRLDRIPKQVYTVATQASKDKEYADFVCDGVNDEVTIQDALDSLPANGGTVKLFAGTYLISNSIELGNAQELRGQGFGTVIKVADGINGNFPILTNNNYVGGNSNIRTNNFLVDGNKANNVGGSNEGIYLENVDQGCLSLIRTQGGCSARGIWLDTSPSVTIDKCIVEDFDEEGIYLSECPVVDIRGNRVINNGFSGVWVQGSSEHVRIQGNHIQSGSDNGVFLSDCAYVSCLGNTIRDIMGVGIYFYSLTGSHIAYNIIENVDEQGIYYGYDSQNVIVGHNIIDGALYDGIGISEGTYIDVIGNIIRNCGLHGIALEWAENCGVKQNSIFGCSQTTDNNKDGVNIYRSIDCHIQGNTVRHLGGAKQHRYGIYVENANSVDNLVTNNDLLNSGRTGSLQDGGTGTVTVAGNRL